MAQLTTTHDRELNQKVFKLRGDEGYTRETKISIADTEQYSTSYLVGFTMTLEVTLLRGLGASTLVVYDGDNAIQIVDWLATDEVKEIETVYLAYDIDHNISVKFMGNNECMGSVSNTVLINIENSHGHQTNITHRSDLVESVTNTITFGGQLVDVTDNNSPLASKSIKVYVDDEYDTTVTTASDGSFTRTRSDLDNGKHKIIYVFDGDTTQTTHYFQSNDTYFVSLGKDINIDNNGFPSLIVAGNPFSVKGTAKTWFGDYVNVSSYYYFVVGSNNHRITSNNGVLQFNNIDGLTNGQQYAITDAYGNSSPTVRANVVTPSSIIISSDRTTVHPSLTANIIIRVNGSNIQSNIPVVVNGGGYNNSTYFTDSTGTVRIKYTGNTSHDGEVTITASCGNVSSSITLENLLFYYGNEMTTYAPMTKFGYNIVNKTDGISLPIPSDGNFVAIGIGEGSTTPIGDYELTFDMVSDRYQVIFNQGSFANDYGRYGNTPWNSNDERNLRVGAKIKIIRTGTTIKAYRKDRNESSYSLISTRTDANPHQGLYPVIYVNYTGSSWYMKQGEFKINNIRLKKISE